MNLASEITPALWSTIQASYEAGTYSHAILEACQRLTDVLRERAAVDADGVALVGQALNGDSPRLRLNKLQTNSEKNEQDGFAHILRGLYVAIRNPRSHERMQDDKPTADSIIVFIDYLLSVIGQSEQTWSMDRFLQRIIEPDFVPTQPYADILCAEIPAASRLEAAIMTFRNRSQGEADSLAFVTHALMDLLTHDELVEYMGTVSRAYEDEELTFQAVRELFLLLVPEHWSKLGDAARLRVEHKILKEIRSGIYDTSMSRPYRKGGLATWARRYLTEFGTFDKIRSELLHKLSLDSTLQSRYVIAGFLPQLISLTDSGYLISRATNALANIVIDRHDDWAKIKILEYYFPDSWHDSLVKSMAPLAAEDPDYYSALEKANEIPF